MKTQNNIFLILLAATAQATNPALVDGVSKDNSAQCDYYIVDGTAPGNFQYHRFWDFRNIPSDGQNDYTTAPAIPSKKTTEVDVTSSYFKSANWTRDWEFLDGISGSADSESLPKVWSNGNIYISRNTTQGASNPTFLTLRAARQSNFMSVAEMDSKQKNVLHGSFRTRMRIIPNGLPASSAPTVRQRPLVNKDTGSNASHPVDVGALAGFFTYQSDTQESDIEILTRDPTNVVRYTNQPDHNSKGDIPGASTQYKGLDTTQWIDHRLDWFDGVVRWYQNDKLVLTKTLNAPTVTSGLIVNMWGNGDEYWSGTMASGGQATVAIEWIEIAFNISGSNPAKRQATKKAVTCRLDGVQKVGFPETI